MPELPTTAPERTAARDRLIVEAVIRAIRKGTDAYRSLSCQAGKHAPGGCQNSGTSCLCQCHDPAPAAPGGGR